MSSKFIRSAAALALALGAIGLAPTGAPADPLPYDPEGKLPAAVKSPPVDPRAPFTPTVVSLLRQLEPAQPDPVNDERPAPGTTREQLLNAAKILHGTELGTTDPQNSDRPCIGVGANRPPTGTTPAIAPMCWVDAMGIGVGGQQRNRTTAQPQRTAQGATWNPDLAHAWGQAEGAEGRQVGVTGIYGPQADLLRIPNWGRNISTYSEDPFLMGTLAAAEINGIQGRGLLAQPKHFAMYHGGVFYNPVAVQDQAAHELLLPSFEYEANGSGVLPGPGNAASFMCSYQVFEIVPAPGVLDVSAAALEQAAPARACQHPFKNRIAREQWGWEGFFATDYRLAYDNTKLMMDSGTDQEMSTDAFYGDQLVAQVLAGTISLKQFNTAIARILYQQERFHLLGHPDADSDYLSNSNPSEAEGRSSLTPKQKAEHGATTMRTAEQASVLLKNDDDTLPITGDDLKKKGVLVVGLGAEYLTAMPAAEAAAGHADRNAISPLEQLKEFAPKGSKITYLPWVPGSSSAPGVGRAVPNADLSSDGATIGTGLTRTAGPGAPTTDSQIDFTARSGNGHLEPGKTYTWTGYVNVPAEDNYTFRFQSSVKEYRQGGNCFPACVPVIPGAPAIGSQGGGSACGAPAAPTFRIATDGDLEDARLSPSGTTETGIATSVTMAGYTERGLANCQFNAGTLSPGMHQIEITWTTPDSLAPDPWERREPGVTQPSLRFAYSRAAADDADAVAAARAAGKVVVFAGSGNSLADAITPLSPMKELDAARTSMIDAMAEANENTAVVLNTDVAILMPWQNDVKSIMQSWFAGSEGGTAIARLLLGKANPGGHLPMTWPASGDHTLYTYNETVPNYEGATTGVHPERLNQPPVNYNEGLFIGYRWFDRQDLKPLYPFGHGLSYTTFSITDPAVKPKGDGYDVSFKVRNTGRAAGAVVPQVYIGQAPEVPAGVQQVERSLAGFDRVELKPGQSRRRTIHIGPGENVHGWGNVRAFQYWSTSERAWVTAPGARKVWVGTAAADDRLQLASAGATPP